MKKLVLAVVMLSAVVLAACGYQEDASWSDKVETLAQNSDSAQYKLSALQEYAATYELTDDELNTFAKQIVATYEDGQYIKEDTEQILENIFKAKMVLDYSDDEAMKEFAASYFVNASFAYVSPDEVDADFLAENEQQMNETLRNL